MARPRKPFKRKHWPGRWAIARYDFHGRIFDWWDRSVRLANLKRRGEVTKVKTIELDWEDERTRD